ncbi:glycosyltransferase [Vibrio parahaemolyticus]|uniref:glycosyltransferase n=1 Tax=Vibrio parahaemolyticus TaxID=670 RepID=UPI002269CF03|nr:glycosyltransferase [Vibrio parahaemolyticus]MCX8905523.1 glycosyltransferase [Vibrio parahaemolyticus]
MKKIIFIESYYKGLYGAPKSMLELASGLNSKEYLDVSLITSKNGPLAKKSNDLGINSFVLPVPELLLKPKSKFKLYQKIVYPFLLIYLWFKQLFNINLIGKSDYICVNDIRSFLFYLPIIFILRDRVSWYVRINDRVKFISSIAAALSNKIILISSDCSDVLSENEKQRYQKKLTILNTGFNFKSLDYSAVEEIKGTIEKYNKVYITVGSICIRKNQLDIVRAFGKVYKDGDVLLMIGSPPTEIDIKYQDEVLNLINDSGLKDNVIIVPYTPFVNEYLSLSDIFLFASHKEGLPRVVIEALNAGCFVCSSLVDGIRDIIDDSNKGLVTSVKSNDPLFHSEFVNKILSIDKSQLSERGLRKKYISKKFGYDDFISGFEKIAFNKDV